MTRASVPVAWLRTLRWGLFGAALALASLFVAWRLLAAVDFAYPVLYDALGITPQPPRFARNFLAGASGVTEAMRDYVESVRERRFPGVEQTTE